MVSDRGIADSKAIAQAERLGEVPRSDLDLVTPGAKFGDHRPHHQHVRGVGQVNPDPHPSAPVMADTTSRACPGPKTGLIGSAMLVAASSSVAGRLGVSRGEGTVAGWLGRGMR